MDGQMGKKHTELDEHLRQCISERQLFLKIADSRLRLTS
jgi:predicted anti-sigma-YlaC factor YlaD